MQERGQEQQAGRERPRPKIDRERVRCPNCGRSRLLQPVRLDDGTVVRRWKCRCRLVEKEQPSDPALTTRERAACDRAVAFVAERAQEQEARREKRAERRQP